MMVRIVRLLPRALVVVAVCLVVAGCGNSGAKKKKSKKAKGPTAASAKEAPQPATDGFVVVQVNGEARVVAQSELESVRFELRSGYREALREHKKAKKKAEAAGATFETPKPPKPKLRISKRVFPTEAEAQAYRKRLPAGKKAGGAAEKKPPSEEPVPEGN